MTKRKLIIEMKYNSGLAESALAAAAAAGEARLDPGLLPKIVGVEFDASFAPTQLPGMVARSATTTPYVSGAKFDLSLEPADSTYIVRAEVDESRIEALSAHQAVAGVYADIEIQPTIICPGSPPMGTFADVERLLCTAEMRRKRMDGSGVLVAIVDTGINAAHLAARGRPITIDVARSWTPRPGMTPGDAPVGHGTMCAFDASLAAPRATFLDIQLLRSTAGGPTIMSGLLSDAVRAYGHLGAVMTAPRRPGETRSLVVNNSWGMFHPSWDFPVGHPGNYSDNPNHPFNRIVATLEQLGADILFAAGNCGSQCPDGRCGGVTANAIYGANGHPSVLTIAGVDISRTRVGYSSQGPGRLSRNKPDLSGYTHFQGSGVYAADGGTSAATPVVAGVVAAVRTRRPFVANNPSASPAAIRGLMRSTAQDLGTAGFDLDHGFGVVNGCALARMFAPVVRPPIDFCRRFPHLCLARPDRFDLCRRFPHLCHDIGRPPRPPFPPVPPIPPIPGADPFGGEAEGVEGDWAASESGGYDVGALMDAAWRAGYFDGERSLRGGTPKSESSGGCGCGDNRD